MFQRGDIVQAMLYGGGCAERRVVAQKGKVVVVCSEAEYQAALEEQRDPEGVGFPIEDVAELQPA